MEDGRVVHVRVVEWRVEPLDGVEHNVLAGEVEGFADCQLARPLDVLDTRPDDEGVILRGLLYRLLYAWIAGPPDF